jgi:hypothetical protein
LFVEPAVVEETSSDYLTGQGAMSFPFEVKTAMSAKATKKMRASTDLI